jgi:hypothetical protein
MLAAQEVDANAFQNQKDRPFGRSLDENDFSLRLWAYLYS